MLGKHFFITGNEFSTEDLEWASTHQIQRAVFLKVSGLKSRQVSRLLSLRATKLFPFILGRITLPYSTLRIQFVAIRI